MFKLTVITLASAVATFSLGGFDLIPIVLANVLFFGFCSIGITFFALALLFSPVPWDEPPNRPDGKNDPEGLAQKAVWLRQ